jgi:NhaP-type Na+/H+ or K+/H+ antiporter
LSWSLATLGLTLLLVAGVSGRLTGTALTPAMVVVAIGVLVGPLVLGDLTIGPSSSTVRTLAEATLAAVLFSDASRVDLSALRRERSIPIRLLGIGLPLTIVLGALLADALLPSLSLSGALILGVILAPTDAGLGSAVVTDPRLPQRVRQSLNVESGLNDGICVPVLLIVLAAAQGPAQPVHVVVEEIGFGALGGILAGGAAGAVMRLGSPRRLIDKEWRPLIPIAAAILAYGAAGALGGSGFIAAFIAGGLFGAIAKPGAAGEMHFIEQSGALLGSVTFLVFGAVLLGPELEHLTWQVVLYAVMSLTLVRMLPVALAMIGTHARAPTVGLIGWFGPRGLASIVFAVIVEDAHQPHTSAILTAAYLTVGLSVMAHGASAVPLARRYATWYGRPGGSGRMEAAPAHEHRTRWTGAAPSLGGPSATPR